MAVTGLDEFEHTAAVRFNDIQTEVLRFAKRCGFVVSKVRVIPVLGLPKAPWNVLDTAPSPFFPFLSGVCPASGSLWDALATVRVDRMLTFDKWVNKPLRFTIETIRRYAGREILLGRVLTGALRRGQRVTVAPTNEHAVVQSLQVDHSDVPVAGIGQFAGVVLQFDGPPAARLRYSKRHPTRIRIGYISCAMRGLKPSIFRAKLLALRLCQRS